SSPISTPFSPQLSPPFLPFSPQDSVRSPSSSLHMEWIVLGALLSCIVLLPLIIYLTYKYTRKPATALRIGSVENGENGVKGGNKISVISSEFDGRSEEPPRRKTIDPHSNLLNAPPNGSTRGRRLSASFLHEQSMMDPGQLPKDIQVEMERIEAEKMSK
ncbi:hypothetical protein PENTCL1PPCAC_26342, partial [Pristionchus entomophagus]